MKNLLCIINGGLNKKTGGQNAFFSCDGKYFYADLSTLPDHSNEIMIFKADKDGNVTDWYKPVYTDYPPLVSHDELLKHIKIFAEMLKHIKIFAESVITHVC